MNAAGAAGRAAPAGEVYISFRPPELIDAAGTVSDERVREFIAAFAARFARLVERMAA